MKISEVNTRIRQAQLINAGSKWRFRASNGWSTTYEIYLSIPGNRQATVRRTLQVRHMHRTLQVRHMHRRFGVRVSERRYFPEEREIFCPEIKYRYEFEDFEDVIKTMKKFMRSRRINSRGCRNRLYWSRDLRYKISAYYRNSNTLLLLPESPLNIQREFFAENPRMAARAWQLHPKLQGQYGHLSEMSDLGII